VPYEFSPKLIVTTNYIIDDDSPSAQDRLHELELYPFYSSSHRPIDDFGKELWGHDFTEQDWADFDATMLTCLSNYLIGGVITPPHINIKERFLYTKVGADRLSFIINQIERRIEENKNDLSGSTQFVDFNKTTIFDEYRDSKTNTKYQVSTRKYIQDFARVLEYMGYKFEHKRTSYHRFYRVFL
jgi:hypothetical protein